MRGGDGREVEGDSSVGFSLAAYEIIPVRRHIQIAEVACSGRIWELHSCAQHVVLSSASGCPGDRSRFDADGD